MANRWETMETVTDFILRGSKITQMVTAAMKLKDSCFLGKKAMKNLDSILKNRDITLPRNIHIDKAVFFSVVVYGCES